MTYHYFSFGVYKFAFDVIFVNKKTGGQQWQKEISMLYHTEIGGLFAAQGVREQVQSTELKQRRLMPHGLPLEDRVRKCLSTGATVRSESAIRTETILTPQRDNSAPA